MLTLPCLTALAHAQSNVLKAYIIVGVAYTIVGLSGYCGFLDAAVQKASATLRFTDNFLDVFDSRCATAALAGGVGGRSVSTRAPARTAR